MKSGLHFRVRFLLYPLYSPASGFGDQSLRFDPAFFIYRLNCGFCFFCILRLDKRNNGWSRTGERRRSKLTSNFIRRRAAGDMPQPIWLMNAVFHHFLKQIQIAIAERIHYQSSTPDVVDGVCP